MKRARLHQIYREARELIAERKSWRKRAYHTYSEEDGAQFCLFGALSEAAKQDLSWADANKLRPPLNRCIGELFPGRGDYTEHFNDHPRTKHTDVLKVLDCAIADTAPRPRKEPA